MEECSKVFVENTIDSRIRSVSAQLSDTTEQQAFSTSVPEASHLLPRVSFRLGMYEMPQGKGEEHDSVLDPTFEDTTCEQSHIQPNHSPV